MLYAIETTLRDGVSPDALPGLNSQEWERISLAPADMDTTLIRLQYYRKNWGTQRRYRLARVA